MNIISDYLTDAVIYRESTGDGNWHKGREGKTPRIIVLHATADNNINSSRNWFRTRRSAGKPVFASSHYIIDTNGDIYAEVREEDTAYHAGVSTWDGDTNINDVSIGVEMTNLNNGIDTYDLNQYNSAVVLVKYLVGKYNIKRENVVTHAQVAKGRKTDPRGFPMQKFLDEVFAPVDPWTDWGQDYPLPVQQRSWLIPQTWLKNNWLGAAKCFEQYLEPNTSVQMFENGTLVYRKQNNKVYIVKY